MVRSFYIKSGYVDETGFEHRLMRRPAEAPGDSVELEKSSAAVLKRR
jgi:hypothetical protein